ncbi:MBL fold metallo-hydrolase [Superficieibacter electus]|uniref:MBL fold metallo-hydrolase n=1 Tax=Superficieibacter electus TaxID=2022662 RepID=A0A2P5GU99_9ENTR|nr:MBL fold metallo-hydrolase [Superficieibacter electus]POP47278.1 MBL fold metallo-hydrolase [Superficieibacter electus]POP50125.1 MBL fold metallo-hydrolase [Superficieibacter electus]
MAKITTFEIGYCTHIGCMALKGAGLRVCKFPSRAYLLEAGNQRWLWDTGYASWFEQYTRSGVFRIYRQVTPVYFDSETSLVKQLLAQGLVAGDISAIILSHFHADHVAGLRDFPDSKCICSGEGWAQVRALRGLAALRQAFVPGLFPAGFESNLTFIEHFPTLGLPAVLAPFEQGYVLPGSEGQIILVPLPGHAAGHIGAFILTDDGWTLLAADAAWSPANYRELRGPSRLAHLVMSDTAAYYQTLGRLNQLWHNGVTDIRLCHEGDL